MTPHIPRREMLRRSLGALLAAGVWPGRLDAQVTTSTLVGLVRDGFELIPGGYTVPARFFRARGMDFTGVHQNVAFEYGILLIAAGMIVGMRVSGWMGIATVVNHTVLAQMARALSSP